MSSVAYRDHDFLIGENRVVGRRACFTRARSSGQQDREAEASRSAHQFSPVYEGQARDRNPEMVTTAPNHGTHAPRARERRSETMRQRCRPRGSVPCGTAA